MSLEAALKENTEALNKLSSILANMPVQIGEPVPETPCKASEGGHAIAPDEITYDEVKKPFLALVNKDRDAALAILKKHGAESLKAFEGKPEKLLAIFNDVKEASNV